ncbi:CBS domain-containing protein [Micromonosporaceae bacterium Da 78-11]
MQQWRVKDVMSTNVVTAERGTSISELAGLLTRERISAVPIVTDDGRVVGIVSEADLMARIPGTGAQARPAPGAADAEAVMSRPVHTAAPDELLSTAARRMRKHNVRRLPVTDETGRTVGVVSRADLMRHYTRSDDAIRHDITHDVLRRTLWIEPQQVGVCVDAGVVTLTGEVGRRSTAAIAGRLSADVTGVLHVVNNITYGFDDTTLVRSRISRTHPFSAEPFRP